MSDATSLADSTTESGPVGWFRRRTSGFGLAQLEPAECRLEAGEGGGPGVPRCASERDVGAERPRFRGKPERREFLLHTVLQDLEPGLRRDAHPHDARPPKVGKHPEPAERER